MRSKFILSEVGVGLFRNVTMSVAMVLTTAISLALLGAGGLIFLQVGKMKEYFYYQLEVTIFVKDNITPDQKSKLQTQLDGDGLVESQTFESKQTAYTRFKEQFKDSPELVNNVSPSALPASFRVKLKDPTQFQAAAGNYQKMAGVDSVVDQRKIVDKLFQVLDTLRNIAIAIAFIQGVAAMLLIGNTVQVAAYSRRKEVSVMRLVGASNWYIQLPFVLEAAFAGLVGAVIGWLSLLGVKFLLVDRLIKSGFALIVPSWDMLSMFTMLGVMVLLGAGLSAIAGWFTLRFQIKF